MLSHISSLSEHKLSVFRLDHGSLDQDTACLYPVHNLSLMLFLISSIQRYQLQKEKKDLHCNTFAAIGKCIKFKFILLALQGWNHRMFRKMKLLNIVCLHYTEDTYQWNNVPVLPSVELKWGWWRYWGSKSKTWSHTFGFVNSKNIQLLVYSFCVMLAGFKMQAAERIQNHLQMQSSLLMRTTGSLLVLSDSKYGIHCLLAEPNYRLFYSLLVPKYPQAAEWEQKMALVQYYTPFFPTAREKGTM